MRLLRVSALRYSFARAGRGRRRRVRRSARCAARPEGPMSHWTRQLTALRACAEAITWAKGYDSLDAAWHACERADWMLWLAGHCAGDVDSASRQRVVLAACACARTALKHTKDPRPLKAIETAEAWARGEAGVTLDDVRNARVAAAAAAYAADAAADAAA